MALTSPSPPPRPSARAAVDVLLADGTAARLRPVGPGDAEAVRRLFSGLSRDSLVMRFFGPHRVTDAEIERICGLDGVDGAALAIEVGEELVALAEYDRRPGAGEAEVAFVVADAHQGRGAGTLLLEHLAAWARQAGVQRFVVETLSVNAKMLGVLRAAGFARQYERDASVTRVVLDIAPTEEALAAAAERDRQATVRSMLRLLRPRSVAVIGASRQPGTIGHEILRNLVASGFTGPVFPVNPEAQAIAALPTWPSIEAVPAPVDLAVVSVPAPAVLEVTEACGRAGVGALVVVSAGFAETGPAGAELERQVTRAAHRHGMRLIGPNCFGVVNADPLVKLNATFAPDPPRVGPIGFASQSGGLGIAILAEAAQRGLGISTFVSMGNKADVSSNDLLSWWLDDPETKVALLYLESFGNPPKFRRLAGRFSRAKPIVAVKSGRSRAGTRAARSHTAAHASPERAVDALLEQTGVLRVSTVEELFDVGAVLAHQPLPAGPRVGILGNAGGPGVLAADAVAGWGLEVPELSPGLQDRLHAFLPPEAGVANPVDMVASATPDHYRQALELLLASGEVDAVIVIFTPPLTTTAEDVAAALVHAVDHTEATHVPVVAAFLGTERARHRLQAAVRPIPSFTYPESAARAVAHAVRYSRWRATPEDPPATFDDLDPNGARQLLAEAAERADGDRRSAPSDENADEDEGALWWVPPEVAWEVLGRYRLPGVLGRPLPDPTAAAAAKAGASGGLPLLAGVLRDAAFGALVVLAAAGPLEDLDDSATRVAPLSRSDARFLVQGRRTSSLLAGGPDRPPADTQGLEELLLRLGRLAEDLPEIATIDLNPVLATPEGPLVLGAKMAVFAQPAEPLGTRPRQLR
ncbi:GNAT family N-acetyltransferase [Aciditerrimonas ferrireducens]|uniref:GNAT family N-acetyltransferase n=1 Tax=Aciditerrimonas ferrireducens TaxID=667306 RepID=A0ABV6C4H7_9ACTN